MRYVSTEEFVQRIKAGRIKPVLPMIAQKARVVWHTLPISEQGMLSEADLIQAGINFTVTHVAVKFNLSRNVKFATYLFSALDNFYADIIRKVYAEKRLIPRGIASLDTQTVNVNGHTIRLLDKIKLTRRTRLDSEEAIVNRIDAERMFVQAYAHASPILRRYLIRWLLQPKVSKNKEGQDASYAKRELKQYFSRHAKSYMVPELCETIQKDWICRNNIANKISHSFHTAKRKTKSGFFYTEEFAVANILSQKQLLEVIPTIG